MTHRQMEHGDVMDCLCFDEANGIVCTNKLCPWSEPNEWFWSKMAQMPRSGQQNCHSCVHLDRHHDCGNAFSRMFRRPTGVESWCINWKGKTDG